MISQSTIATIQEKFKALAPLMDERMRRRWAACEANSLGRGGLAAVAAATGLSRTTIQAGRAELREPTTAAAPARVRRPGAGRPRLDQQDPRLLRDLQTLLEPVTRGDPQSPLLWTCKSTRNRVQSPWHQKFSGILRDCYRQNARTWCFGPCQSKDPFLA